MTVITSDNYTLYQGDCLDILPTLAAGSIDAVIADIPYGTTACSWDTVIPFAPMWAGIKHGIKQRAAVVLFGSEPFSSMLRLSNLEWYKYDWVWDKHIPRGFNNARFRPMNRHENLSVFGDGGINYYPIMKQRNKPVTVKNYGASLSNRITTNDGMPRTYDEINPDTIIRGKWMPNGGKVHPTQKPVALMEYLIKTYTNPGDLVLDFTMGSGTTGVACMKTGRRFIGIELDPGYFQTAHERIANAAGEYVTTAKERATGQLALWDAL